MDGGSFVYWNYIKFPIIKLNVLIYAYECSYNTGKLIFALRPPLFFITSNTRMFEIRYSPIKLSRGHTDACVGTHY